jgi:ABC-type bacteriocin/lantibiotic exporter with double-glycine peptidase domain
LEPIGPSNGHESLKFNAAWQQPNRCGPNALYVLLRLKGIAASYDEVLGHFRIDDRRGVSLADLSRVADNFKLRHRIIKVSDAEITKLTPPFIVHEIIRLQSQGAPEEEGHFFVLNKFDTNSKSELNFNIIDGVSGYYEQISAERVARSFSGYVLLPEHKSSGGMVQFLGWLFLYFIAAICLLLLGIAGFRQIRQSAGSGK